MNRKEIHRILRRQMSDLDELSRRVALEFKMEDIHHFRIGFKKLRAFLRLVTAGRKQAGPLLPVHLKTFYGYAGIIRNIQLHRHELFRYTGDEKLDPPANYLAVLDREESHWKTEAVALQASLDQGDLEFLLKKAPDRLDRPVMRRFVETSRRKLRAALRDLPADEAIHAVRKTLKDFLYTHPYLEGNVSLPPVIADPERLKQLTDQAGVFMDHSLQSGFLQDANMQLLKEESERIILGRFREFVRQQKQALLGSLLPELGELHESLTVKRTWEPCQIS